MKRPSERPHPLELEQWLLSEQSPQARAHTEARLDAAAQRALREQDDALRARLLAAHPPAVLAARVRARLAPPRRKPVLVLGGLVAACALLLFLRVPGDPPSERAKGQAMELRVYRQRGAEVERLVEGAQVAPHELLQLAYLRDGHSHGVLLSIDGRGAVTLHYPHSRTDSTELASGSGEQLLERAYELDDAPAFERFIFVGAEGPLSVDEVLAAARALSADPVRARGEALPLQTPNQQRWLLLRKAAPP